MNRALYLILLLSSVFFACESVIEIDLDESETRLVIEGILSEDDQQLTVMITETASYFDPAEVIRVGGAEIELVDQHGNRWAVEEKEQGVYMVKVDQLDYQMYELVVNVQGQEYRAKSELLPAIPIAEVYGEYQEGFGPIEAGYLIYVRYQDPAEVENRYRIRYYIDEELQNASDDFVVFNDDRNDGQLVNMTMVRKTFEEGVKMKVELIHFDAPSFAYFSTLGNIIGGGMGPGGGATPANPTSNWSNNALGYFSAQSRDVVNFTVR